MDQGHRSKAGHEIPGDFGPAELRAVRQRMIDANLCRNVINARINRIRRMFKWGVEKQFVPSAVLQGLQAVAPNPPLR